MKLIDWGKHSSIYLNEETNFITKRVNIEDIYYNEKNIGILLHEVDGVNQFTGSNDINQELYYQYIEGKDFNLIMRTMTEKKLIVTLRKIATIIDSILEKGVVPIDLHRDNIIVNKNKVTIIDFGSYTTIGEVNNIEVPIIYKQLLVWSRHKKMYSLSLEVAGLIGRYEKTLLLKKSEYVNEKMNGGL